MSGLESGRTLLDIGTKDDGAFAVDANVVATGRTCVLGSSGSGKSYAVGVICEELCRHGVPFAVVDTEGEHTGLKEKFDAIWVGEERGSDLSWEGLDLADLARQAPDISPLILDVSDIQDAKAKVAGFMEGLYETLNERRTPYLVVVEEADKFVPQLGERVPIFAEAARRGRKRGLGLMVCSQRPSLVDKNVLSQCGNQLIGKLIIQNDLQSVAQFFPGKGVPRRLTSLKTGQFFAMGGFSADPTLVSVKSRVTRPGGVTPSLASRVVKQFSRPSGSPAAPPAEDEAGDAPAAGGLLGLEPSIKTDDLPVLVKRERSFGIFGPRETVTEVNLYFRTLVQLGVRLRRGLIKRRFRTAYVHLDGASGKLVSVGKGLEVTAGFEKLLGLSTLQVEILRELRPDSDTSVIDVASVLGESKGTVSRALGALNAKRLVRSSEVRKKKLYRRLVDLPPVPSGAIPLDLVPVDQTRVKVVGPRVKESDVRDAVKGLWDGADVDSFDTFLYPVFKVELVARRKHREVTIDGRTGRELVF
ncbi:MAG: DUF87 domain-containing protein [Nitrososphaerota archaeon]|nr:DUF87 domain-containing protein [Nitrososphaerota archaeon]MDG6970112.1 DUF87 domain-containing protein [Nitrososphaerota archaeon]MDG7004537.1 DUF87 domain-containing protein [Nitrososphaerota archaeon]MDG7019802.1 DUF87 domain-containing protein [Nitrososphaerota archaeon]